MILNLGLDNGYAFTKTSKDVCIYSTLTEGVDQFNAEKVLQVKHEGKNYIVGEPNGNYIADADKLKSDENRRVLLINTLTAIGLSFPTRKNINLNVVVGVPVLYFDNQKDDMKKLMESIKEEKIYINRIGKVQTITIENVLVYPQSVGVVFKHFSELKNKKTMVIDIGGGTWDISEFDSMKLVNKDTYQAGMISLYEKIASDINKRYYTKLQQYDIYDLIQRGTFTANGEVYDIMPIADPIIDKHIKPIMDGILRTFNVISSDHIFLIGGGASELENKIAATIKNAIPEENTQFSNAYNFELIAKARFADKE